MAGNKIGSGSFSNAAILLKLLCAVMMVGWKVSAEEYTVGGKGGWIVGTNYTKWADDIKFHVGDTLEFKYNKKYHDVLEVTKANYDSCTASKPLSSANTGNDTVLLEKPGPHYFICGFPGHCEAGQKLEITVTAAAAAGVPSPSPLSSGASPASSPSKSPALSPSPKAAGSQSPPPNSHGNTIVSAGTGILGIMGSFWIFSFLAIM